MTLAFGSYFAVTFFTGALALRSIDPDTAEIESILGRKELSDGRPVTALTLAATLAEFPLTLAPDEQWSDWHGPVPVVYLAS